ncbi:MAG: hypothetical protein Q9163_001501 [Psora crenata]
MAEEGKEAYCTLLMSDGYLPGAMVLGHSLRDAGTKKQLAVLVTLDSVSVSAVDELKKVYDQIIPVNRIINRSPANLYLMDRPDLASTFTKIALWRQTQFSHLVYLDSDIVALRAPDELFAAPPAFAAAPDIGWPDCFNSGVLSLKPNMGDYYALVALAERGISFDGADQGLLNMHFRDWERLSFTYNCTPSGNYQYVPAYRHFQSTISMVHYIGHDKPWVTGRDHGKAGGVHEELLGRWWAVYDKHYRIPKTTYASSKAGRQSGAEQHFVSGETLSVDYGSSSISVGPRTDEPTEPEAPRHITQMPLADLADETDTAGEVEKAEATPIPTVEQRRFSVDWDPLHQPPPPHSRPEAANFPNQIYDMSSDPRLFQAPQPPEPPKNMYYDIPPAPSRTEHPKPIFPWEGKALKPTRVFAEDLPPAPSPSAALAPETTDSTATATETKGMETETVTPSAPTISPAPAEPFATYDRTNAWDDVPEIERYIASLPQNWRLRGQVQPAQTSTSAIPSPENEKGPPSQSPRRPSMKITDFPTERLSLPVTPAPVQRRSFWGAERNAAGELPAAEGVPEQSEWDPVTRLTELQMRQKEVLENGPPAGAEGGGGRAIPQRTMPENLTKSAPVSQADVRAATTGLEATTTTAPGEPASMTAPALAPAFDALSFATGSAPLHDSAVGGEVVGPTGS